MREIFSNSIDYKSGQGGSVYITSTGTGAFQGFVACEDTVISSVKDQNGLQILNELGLSGYTVKQGIYIGAPKGRYISEITLTSGSIIGYYTLTGGSQIAMAFSGLLDTYSGAAAAYSLRLLSSTYTGSAIRVRRASDNAEQNIGFASNELDVTALTSFCSGTDGFVTTWYDQSGNGYNASQTTAANQPQIVSGGSVITTNNKPAILGNGTTTKLTNFNFTLSGDYYISILSKLNNIGLNMYLGTIGTSGYIRAVDNGTQLTVRHNGETGGADFNISVGTTQLLNTVQRVSTTMNYAQNSSNNSTTERATQGVDFQITTLMDGYNNQYEIDGTMQEVVIYNSNQSSNRTGIETNINDFYSIY